MELGDATVGDLDDVLDVRRRSFGPQDPAFEPRWRALMIEAIDEGRALCVRDGGRVVAAARILPLRQWWCGRDVALGGVGGVVVAPEARGRGVGAQLMAGVLGRIAERGDPISALYPATVPLYRRFGWELGGTKRIVELPSEAVRTLAVGGGTVALRRASPDDAELLIELLTASHRQHRDCGPLEFEAREWRRELDEERDEYFVYLADDGFVAYGFDDGTAVLDVTHLVATSEATTRALWSLVGSGSSIAKVVRVAVGPGDPLPWLGREWQATVHSEQWWMLRVVDAVAAVAARGFPSGVSAHARLTITDAERPGNDGHHVLEVGGGIGDLRPTAPGPDHLHVGAGGFAALYSGTHVATLRRAGLASGGSAEGDAALDAAFGATAFALDYF